MLLLGFFTYQSLFDILLDIAAFLCYLTMIKRTVLVFDTRTEPRQGFEFFIDAQPVYVKSKGSSNSDKYCQKRHTAPLR